MGVLIFIVAILLIIVCLIIASEEPVFIFVGAAIFAIFFIFPYVEHVSDITTIHNHDRIVEIQEKRIDRISSRLDKVEDKGNSTWNKDTPVATMMDSLVEAENKITEAQENILSAEMSIQKRENGITSYILWFAPESIEEK